MPSEAGLTTDALAAWDWLRAHGAAPEDVLVVGNSLGTGVAVQFASALQEIQLERGVEPQTPRGVVLLAPFSSIESLLDTYYIMGLVPLLAPLRVFPFLSGKSFAFVRATGPHTSGGGGMTHKYYHQKRINYADILPFS